MKDKGLLKNFIDNFKSKGLNLFIAEHQYDTLNTISKKIEKLIRDSDFAIILLTKNGFNSNFVQQEIGYINSCNISHIQFVEKGFENKISGFEYGKEFISFDPVNPYKEINKVKNIVIKQWNDKVKKQEEKEIKKQKTIKEIFTVALIAFLWELFTGK